MSRASLTDEDGIDGPFERRIKAPRKGTKRAAPPRVVYGPLEVSYLITWSDSRGSSSYTTQALVRGELAYYRRLGRAATPRILRIESCPARGCNGDGTRSVKRRGSMFHSEIPCVGCLGRHETEEIIAELEPLVAGDKTLDAVLTELGLEHSPANEHGSKWITRLGWPVARGNAGDIWGWLRETGRIL